MNRFTGWKLGAATGCVTLLAAGTVPASLAADRASVRGSALPDSVEALRLPEVASATSTDFGRFDPALATATGRVQVIVHLKSPGVAKLGRRSGSEQAMQREVLRAEQQAFAGKLRKLAPSARTLTRVQMVANAVFIEADAADVRRLAADPNVTRVSRVVDYRMDLAETVPYIGAKAAQNLGFDGKGVKVAVLDSGIDYTHAAFGGPGTLDAYAAAWGSDVTDSRNTTRDGLFPTAKVVEGYDFVGELWPFADLVPDPDPIDLEGHGTHVADIIGGAKGVAPGVSLYAVKVCSAVSSSCSGIALIQGMEYVVDPNGDGDTSDRIDVVNMSLGSNYGQAFDDDLALAVNNASAVGVMTVASAGNGSDKPYITGTPAAAISALSVAQTAVPSSLQARMEVKAPASIAGLYDAVFQPWSTPLGAPIEAPLQYGNGAGGNTLGCSAFPAGSLAGKVVLVDRGSCGFSIKISNIAAGGARAGIIGLVAPGDPFEGGYSGGDATVPGYMVSQALSNRLKSGLAAGVVVRFDSANALPLVMTMVGSSSRGPRNPDSLIKPEIGAPGASISAVAGSGTGTIAFGGTSGAAPMVSGSAALVLDAYPSLRPAEVKARLMNNAETMIETAPFKGLAPVSRIGGGEVRVDRALKAPAAAWDVENLQGGLSFGFVDVSKDVVVLQKRIRVRNYSDKAITYAVKPTFRDPAKASGAVTVGGPTSVTVQPRSDAILPVRITIRGDLLPDNQMNSGSRGANPAALTANEFDGQLFLDDGRHPIHLPWHVLPRKAADVRGRQVLTFRGGRDLVSLQNVGVGAAQTAAYSLLAVSPNLPQGAEGAGVPTPDLRAFGAASFPVPAGFCSANASFVWQFAVNTWERQSHLLPVSHLVFLDTNRDGVDDYAVLNRDASGLETISDGRQVAWAVDLASGAASAFFFAEHATNTGNTVLTVCAEQIGLGGADYGTRSVGMALLAQDFYFGGPGDLIEGLAVTPGAERYLGIPDDVAGKAGGSMAVYDFGPTAGATPELGILLQTNSARTSNQGGAVQSSEALLIRAN
ncbi:MAG: peptidase S8 [Lysobacterales bacterium]|jgi:subtilisin family serine protease|nr:MAG: peptidase S8 [Xanthomonadales bacterium]